MDVSRNEWRNNQGESNQKWSQWIASKCLIKSRQSARKGQSKKHFGAACQENGDFPLKVRCLIPTKELTYVLW